MISLINDYALFGGTDSEIIDMLSLKLGKENNQKISETLFYRLKKEANGKRGESEQWLDSYTVYRSSLSKIILALHPVSLSSNISVKYSFH